MEGYTTPAKRTEARLEEKKSVFIATAAPVQTEAQALAALEAARRAHPTARHHVYAYVLRQENRVRYSDDGEPAKTAGLPVLSAIQHAGLVDCVVVVTRYFGGTLLGTGGLVRAYGGAAKMALEQAGKSEVRPCVKVSLVVDYPLYESAQRLFLAAGAQIEEPAFAERVSLCATLPYGEEDALLKNLDELCRGKAEYEVSDMFYTPFTLACTPEE